MIEIIGNLRRWIEAQGTWQSVFLIEHRCKDSRRRIAVHLMGE